ncbi:hypothetical protein GGF32_007340 [Allomyces javanicus]|nr:hypothetical protein GGF32_007340 [Allomyces javanicus]
MIKYSLVRVFEWIGHLWINLPLEAPAVALTHSVSWWAARNGFSEYAFQQRLERIACCAMVQAHMAPPRPFFDPFLRRDFLRHEDLFKAKFDTELVTRKCSQLPPIEQQNPQEPKTPWAVSLTKDSPSPGGWLMFPR